MENVSSAWTISMKQRQNNNVLGSERRTDTKVSTTLPTAATAAGSARTYKPVLGQPATKTIAVNSGSSPTIATSAYNDTDATAAVKKEPSSEAESATSETTLCLEDDTTANKAVTSNSAIHGIGLWNSWTRNFSTPLLAIWDLLDNAFDAADDGTVTAASLAANAAKRSSIHIDPDHACQNASLRGIVMRNSCLHRISPLSEILKAYKSAKNSVGDVSIGENGVGIKQGCATLSDLSFCLVRNGTEYSLGILALELQTASGIYLPSYDFECIENEAANLTDRLATELLTVCIKDPKVAQVVKKYGNGSLQSGVDQLISHYQAMSNPASYGRWGKDESVFCLILHNLKHNHSRNKNDDEEEEPQPKANTMTNSVPVVVSSLLEQIKLELPLRYLHVNDAILDVQVNRQIVPFSYWQRRLVEMTYFTVNINDRLPYTKTLADPQSLETKSRGIFEGSDDTETDSHTHVLDIYIGFDATRCAKAKDNLKSAALLWYSRRSGRLIKTNKDARGELKLTTGSSNFCQGLTILVDDKQSKLPLNPTKQDFAFGERSHGETHRDNIIAWVSAVVKFYYNYHLKVCNKQKKILTDRVRTFEPKAQELVEHEATTHEAGVVASAAAAAAGRRVMKPIAQCEFSHFEGLEWYLRADLLMTRMKRTLRLVHGKDTLMPLPAQPPPIDTEEELPDPYMYLDDEAKIEDFLNNSDMQVFTSQQSAKSRQSRKSSATKAADELATFLPKTRRGIPVRGDDSNPRLLSDSSHKRPNFEQNIAIDNLGTRDDVGEDIVAGTFLGTAATPEVQAFVDSLAEKVRKMKRTMGEANKTISELKEENESVKREYDSLQKKSKKRREAAKDLQEQVSMLSMEVDWHKKRVEHLEKQVAYYNKKRNGRNTKSDERQSYSSWSKVSKKRQCNNDESDDDNEYDKHSRGKQKKTRLRSENSDDSDDDSTNISEKDSFVYDAKQEQDEQSTSSEQERFNGGKRSVVACKSSVRPVQCSSFDATTADI